MKAWHFSETPYPHLPPAEEYESIRVTLPNRHFDPAIGARLYDRYLDEWVIADDEGMEIMVNEHHATATCLDVAAPVMLGALARMTRKARMLVLGNPIANRREPVRVAEEMAMVDVLSHGRLDCGFVRGVPFEVLPTSSNPVRMSERHWEAVDLILKAWTSHDGPVSHEGRFFHHRSINIWPRPYQQPHPPVWISSTSPGGARQVGGRGYVLATFLTGFDARRGVFENSLGGGREAGRGDDVPIDRLAYAALVYTAESAKRARDGADQLLWYLRGNKVLQHYKLPPGYVPVPVMAKAMRDAALKRQTPLADLSVEGAIEAGLMMAGTPDQVYGQIRQFYQRVGGVGHLLIMGQGGFLDHEDTVHGIKTFAREVYPRLQADYPGTNVSGVEGAAVR